MTGRKFQDGFFDTGNRLNNGGMLSHLKFQNSWKNFRAKWKLIFAGNDCGFWKNDEKITQIFGEYIVRDLKIISAQCIFLLKNLIRRFER